MPAMPAKLTGIVKAVPSGDTLVLMRAGASSGPPPEMRVTLSSVRAPALSRDGAGDDAYAWESREALRARVVGKVVEFVVEYKVEALGRACAAVWEGGEDLAKLMVSKGLVRVRRPANEEEEKAAAFADLCAAEDRAVSDKVGLHSGVGSAVTRKCVVGDIDAAEVVDMCRGKVLKGVVEYVANGSALKVFIRDVPGGGGDRVLTLCLSGVQCPGFKRAEGDVPAKAMPFALNAKFLTEVRLLNRDVHISVEGMDRNGMLFATVTDPNAKMYIGEELLRAGFAKTVSWSIELSANGPTLRMAERDARDRQVGVWKGFKAPTASDELFVGRCMEVVSGDMIAVRDDTTGNVRRITLASVRAPRADKSSGGPRDRSIMAVGPPADAKEALRKKLIGRKVLVTVEYSRAPAEGSVRKDKMVFATVGREGDPKNPDVALPMISDGLLSVVRHRGDEDRAGKYEEYLEREKAAIEAKRGMHGPVSVAAASIRVNNLTGPDAKKRSRDVLSGLQRNGPHQGIVEFVSNASRYRVYLPKESMLISLALRAVRSPQASRKSYLPDGSVRDESAGEPHGDIAANFARENYMQRNVEIEVSAVDRVGAFLGNMYIQNRAGQKEDVSEVLLQNGHGYLHEAFDAARDFGGPRYKAVEKAAKEAEKGLWRDYAEPVIEERTVLTGDGVAKETYSATVCEVGFGGRIFAQEKATSPAALEKVEEGLASLKLDGQPAAPASSLRHGTVVAAKFSADKNWYRARVLFAASDGSVRVRFIDYGNEEAVQGADIRKFGGGAAFISSTPIATEVSLANIVVPDEGDDCSVAAGEYLRELVYGKEVEVAVMVKEGPSKVIGDILIPAASSGEAASSSTTPTAPTSVSQEILRSGFARIVRKSDRVSKAAFQRLRPFELEGVATRQGLWTYGDAYDSDIDEETA